MLKIYNTLMREVQDFKPINPPKVGMYSCGPTVYDYQHIGHMRRYVGDDILVRVLKLNKYEVKHVMNITDVGHLISNADTGEDKMEKGAKKFGMSVWEIAKKFEKQFFDSCKMLNIMHPSLVMHATDYIKDQIELIEILEEKGFTYKTSDGIYFDTSKFKNYSKLAHQISKDLKAGSRVKMGEKKHSTDFALWKFPTDPTTGSGEKRQMEWQSPWGVGFPGWHIECSAMSMRSLGPTFDIHTGGIDHISIHHTNEIAQSEAASGKKFVNFWIHHNFLVVNGEKMSKSLGNIFTVEDIIKKKFNPLALRYLFFQTHYRQEMNFTWEALEATSTSLKNLYEQAIVFGKLENQDSIKPSQTAQKFWQEFMESVNDDLNMSKALAALHLGLKQKESDQDVLYLLKETDQILGLEFEINGKKVWEKKKRQGREIPDEVRKLVKEREALRKQRRFHMSDQLRNKIKKLGYDVIDRQQAATEVQHKKSQACNGNDKGKY